MKLFRLGIGQFQSLSLGKLRDGLDFMLSAKGFVGFHAELVRGRVCLFGFGFRVRVCFLTDSFTLQHGPSRRKRELKT